MERIDVTISLVNYKTPELLLKCIKSIKKYTKHVSYEIIVLDNNSQDESVSLVRKTFPRIKVIASKKNLFATGGNNEIFRFAQGAYFLVLNPDIEFINNAIYKMVQYLRKHENVAAVSCLQLTPDGKKAMTGSCFSTPIIEFWENNLIGMYFPNKKKINQFRISNWNRLDNRVVDVIPDTIMLIRTDVARKLKLYDQNIALFYMENDLCIRIKKLGFNVVHLGTVRVIHAIGKSTEQVRSYTLNRIYERDRLYFYRKHFGFFWSYFLKVTFIVNNLYYILEPLVLIIRRKKRVSATSRFLSS